MGHAGPGDGAARYLGCHLVRALSERGDSVTATDLLADLPPGTELVRWRRLDVLDADAVDRVMPGHDLVFHLAARITLQPRNDTAANITGRRGPMFALPHWSVTGVVPLATAIGRRVDNDVLTVASMSTLRWNPTVDSSKARAEIGHEARPSEQTIRDLISHFVDTGRLDRRASHPG